MAGNFEHPGAFERKTAGPIDPRYSFSNGAPYDDIDTALAAVQGVFRRGCTVLLPDGEYWWPGLDLSDGALVKKGGGSGGDVTKAYVDAADEALSDRIDGLPASIAYLVGDAANNNVVVAPQGSGNYYGLTAQNGLIVGATYSGIEAGEYNTIQGGDNHLIAGGYNNAIYNGYSCIIPASCNFVVLVNCNLFEVPANTANTTFINNVEVGSDDGGGGGGYTGQAFEAARFEGDQIIFTTGNDGELGLTLPSIAYVTSEFAVGYPDQIDWPTTPERSGLLSLVSSSNVSSITYRKDSNVVPLGTEFESGVTLKVIITRANANLPAMVVNRFD